MQGAPVRIHVNLWRKCWSLQRKVRNAKGHLRWITVRRPRTITLRDVWFVVSATKRARVLKTRRRLVHAFAYGTLVRTNSRRPGRCTVPVSYNPFRAGHFAVRATGAPVNGAVPLAYAAPDRQMWCAL